MSLYELIVSGTGEVINIFDWDGIEELIIPEGYITASHSISSSISLPEEFFNEQYGGDFYGNFYLDNKPIIDVIKGTDYGSLKFLSGSNDISFLPNTFSVTILDVNDNAPVPALISNFNTKLIKLSADNLEFDKQDNYYDFLEYARIWNGTCSAGTYDIDPKKTPKISIRNKFYPLLKMDYLIYSCCLTSSNGIEYYDIIANEVNNTTINNQLTNEIISSENKNVWLLDFEKINDTPILGTNVYFGDQTLDRVLTTKTYGTLKYSTNTSSLESPSRTYFKFNENASGSASTWNNSNPTKLLISSMPNSVYGEEINYTNYLLDILQNKKSCNTISLTYESGSDFIQKEFLINKIDLYKRIYQNDNETFWEMLWGQNKYSQMIDDGGKFDNVPVSVNLEDGYFELDVEQIDTDANISINSLLFNYDINFTSLSEINNGKSYAIIVTGSREVITPCWGRKITVYAIGAGGGGGGGVAANDDAHIAVGGAGGSGGNISEYTIDVSGSITLSCLIGKIGTGGSGSNVSWTGSSYNNLPASAAEMINRKGWGFMEYGWDNLVVAPRGNNGGDTIVLWTGNPSSNLSYPWQLVAKGGRGGEGGFGLSVGLNDTNAERPIALGAFSPTVFNANTFGEKTFMAIPGGTPVYTDELWADLPGKPTVYSGGPGGHGISVPFKHYKNITDFITTSSNYVTSSGNDNSAPDLPWGSTNDSATGPKAHPIGVLGFPFGSNIISDKISEYNNSGINYAGSQYLFAIGLNFEKPSNIATTGGGGGLGDIYDHRYINTASLQIGTGGNQFIGNIINRVVNVGAGGNGGNVLLLNNLSVTVPNSGSLYGGGGGGGASVIDSSATITNSEFAGANGAPGAVIILVE